MVGVVKMDHVDMNNAEPLRDPRSPARSDSRTNCYSVFKSLGTVLRAWSCACV